MAEGASFLKAVELRLLRCSLFHPLSSPPPIAHPLIESLVDSIEQGRYADVLSSSEATQLLFGFADSWEFDESTEGASQFYDEVERNIDRFLRRDSETWLQVLDEGGGDDSDVEFRYALVMCLGVAALLAFTQQNVTGPVGNYSPFPVLIRGKEWPVNGETQWDAWAQNQITSIGCGLLGKFSLLQYIVYAKVLLSKLWDLSKAVMDTGIIGCRTTSWWLCRLTLLQQRILDELSSSLYGLLKIFRDETLLHFGKSENIMDYWGSMSCIEEASMITSMAYLEAAILEYKFGRVDNSRSYLDSAEKACGLHLFLTGALGFRTAHQVDAKAQMILISETDHQNQGNGSPIDSSQAQDNDHASDNNGDPNTNGHLDCSDILRRPRLVENDNDGQVSNVSRNVALTAMQQAVVLAQCLHLKRRSREDELSRWEMAPYIEAIDAQQQSCFTIRNFCDLLRIGWESTRSRTKQRALLMMDKVVEGVKADSPVVAKRIQFSYGVYFPAIPALRKEYGEILVSCGLIGEALKIFEDLELWDNLIYCYRLLDKKAAAVDLINARLLVMPTEPKLWCSLGDVTNDDAYYEKALEVSDNKSVRAKRSLARSAYNRKDYETSKILWEAAMAQNSFYPEGWFALGFAALKAGDYEKAVDGFTQTVLFDPENGDAWNNIACLHLKKKKTKEAFVAFKEALKFKRNRWELWANYSKVAFDIGNIGQALEAIKKVLELHGNKGIDVELLDKIMEKIEEKSAQPVVTSDEDSTPENSREIDFLVGMVGNILQLAIRGGGSEGLWGLYARWHKIKGDLLMCKEALLKQIRSYQGSDMWHDVERFKKFAHASLQLCQVCMEIALSTGNHSELAWAERHLSNTIKQAVDFSGTDEYRDLKNCLDKVQNQ
ncbi:tetratricopeptide repeat protein 27 homolog isoform X1 [Dioscorea cayenensis subsp. rotundata]|uniref:Tetratricopeptide repeat protein 27 homolog isoform X1 n=1 Tax=Dioscorea cayennensis subsp. rotundata TaxID=55577 RepID=A0AB40AGS8_DIOCR|nr:tetratricopeptide repeat protein 27 homolog isoform X1 [Dioscorea cayenensis subsp. rotundata]